LPNMPVTNVKGKKIRLVDYTWDELDSLPDKKSLIFVQPMGATEGHGYHLPLGTDTFQAVPIAEAAAKNLSNVIVMPEIPYGFCLDTMSFCGTVSLRADTFIGIVSDIVEGLYRHGFGKFVLFNGHGGNKGIADTALRNALQFLGGPAGQVPRDFRLYNFFAFENIGPQALRMMEGKDYGHACEMETSLMLALDPESVKMERAVEEYMDGDGASFIWRIRDMKEASVSGIHGAANKGTAAKGKELFRIMTEDLENFLRRI